MISFELLTYEDLKVLFNGFQQSFMQVPLSKPTKTLQKYIPKGFRINKLQKKQLIKIYCDAVDAGEPTISKYVQNEIENQFKESKITDYCENTKPGIKPLVSEISVLLWTNELEIPAHIAMLLCGYNCSEKERSSSIKLFEMYFDSIKRVYNQSFEEGFEKGVAQAQGELEIEKKKNGKIEKNIKELKEKNHELNQTNTQLNISLLDAESKKEIANEGLNRISNRIDSLEKKITKVTNELKKTQNDLDESNEKLTNAEKNNERLSKELGKALEEKEHAMEQAYSEEVISKLVSEILDEIRASTLGQKEILELAKKRFAETDTINGGWDLLSRENRQHVEQIIKAFSNSEFQETFLDDLESMEDNLLIQFSITKALKAVLFNSLEKQTIERELSNSFIS